MLANQIHLALMGFILLLSSCSGAASGTQKTQFIFHDDTSTINSQAIADAVKPLLERNILVSIYVVTTGCDADFDNRLQQDNLITDGQLHENTIAIFFPVPKNASCTFIRLDEKLKGEFESINSDILGKGLIPYLADRTPRMDMQILGSGKSYTDTEALARTLDSIDQILWLLETKPHVPDKKLFVYDHRKILDLDRITLAAQPILDRAIEIDLFVLDDNSLSLDMMRDYLGLNSQNRIKSESVIGINLHTHLYRFGTIYTWNLADTFNKAVDPVLLAGTKQVETGKITFSDLVVQSLNAYSVALSSTGS